MFAASASRNGDLVNLQSIVMTVRHRGQRILLTGDMELADPTSRTARIEQGLLTLEGRIRKQRPFAVVKVPHHGSPNGLDPAVLGDLGDPATPGTGVTYFGIITGRDSDDHPDLDVLSDIHAAYPGAAWARTRLQRADDPGVRERDVDRDADPPAARRHDAAGAAVGAGWRGRIRTARRQDLLALGDPEDRWVDVDISAASHSRMGSLPRSRRCPGPLPFPAFVVTPVLEQDPARLEREIGRPAMPNRPGRILRRASVVCGVSFGVSPRDQVQDLAEPGFQFIPFLGDVADVPALGEIRSLLRRNHDILDRALPGRVLVQPLEDRRREIGVSGRQRQQQQDGPVDALVRKVDCGPRAAFDALSSGSTFTNRLAERGVAISGCITFMKSRSRSKISRTSRIHLGGERLFRGGLGLQRTGRGLGIAARFSQSGSSSRSPPSQVGWVGCAPEPGSTSIRGERTRPSVPSFDQVRDDPTEKPWPASIGHKANGTWKIFSR